MRMTIGEKREWNLALADTNWWLQQVFSLFEKKENYFTDKFGFTILESLIL